MKNVETFVSNASIVAQPLLMSPSWSLHKQDAPAMANSDGAIHAIV